MFTSGPVEIGGDYEYVIKLRGRLPGHHHIHPMLAVNGAGPIAGPGGWMDITGNYKDFTNPIKLLVGGTADRGRWLGSWALLACPMGQPWILLDRLVHGQADVPHSRPRTGARGWRRTPQ